MSTTPKPPATPKWALHAVHDIETLTRCWVEKDEEEKAANIIARHHTAAQAETVALLEACATRLEFIERHYDIRTTEHVVRLRAHVAQLKEGAP